MKHTLLVIFAAATLLSGCRGYEQIPEEPLSRIAFGSCAFQLFDTKIFNEPVKQNAQLYIAMGDNIYADNIIGAESFPAWLQWQYDALDSSVHWQRLRRSMPIIATWDDHDYGRNDAGAEWVFKQQSKDVFLKYYKVPADREIYSREGIYDAYYYGDDDHRIQVILLDTRWFRSQLDGDAFLGYVPTMNPVRTMLGDVQWAWLEEELRKPAKVRIIGTSTQFCVEHNGYEAWANMPLQQEKMFETIKNAGAEGVIMISGDVHYAELNKRTSPGLYPIYDLTSSGLTHKEGSPKPSIYRIGDAFADLNFGMIDIDWNSSPVQVRLTAYDNMSNPQISKTISLDELRF
jgi:alkaline phosphatase D